MNDCVLRIVSVDDEKNDSRSGILSLPFELRAAAAFDAKVLSALVRVFIEGVFERYRVYGRARGIARPQAGAVTFVQRFGSSLNLNVHMHVVLLDGVFDRDEHGRVRFHAAPAPTRDEMNAIVRRVHERVARWVERHGQQNAAPSAALEACANIAVRRGIVSRTSASADGKESTSALTGDAPQQIQAVEHEGFNLDASVRIDGDDDLARERLLRYGTRPPFALERFGRRSDGSITYRIKKLAHGEREKVRVMTPLECLARLSSLVPPPRYPLVRYHGVLAPASK